MLPDRYWAKVTERGGCWVWTAKRDRYGYGRYKAGGCTGQAHRLSWEFFRGGIPAGLELDHLCQNTSCVNPDHLEPVTHAVNMARRYATYTECVNGHPFTLENTYIRPSGHRDCRTCVRARVRAYKSRSAA